MSHVDPFEHPEDELDQDPNMSTITSDKGIARAQIAGIRNPFHGPVATGLTPDRLGGLLETSAQVGGENHELLTLAMEIEERDPHYCAVLSTRKLAVTGLAHTIIAPTDDPEDVRIADELRELASRPEFQDLLFDLLDGLGKGYSAVEILWDSTETPWRPSYFHRDPRFFRWDQTTGDSLRVLTDDHMAFGEPIPPFKFVIHRPKLRTSMGSRSGLARTAAALYMLKSYAVKDWMALAEVFGLPIIIGRYEQGANDAQIRSLKSAVAAIGSDARAVISKRMEVEMLGQAQGQGAGAVFSNLVRFIDAQTSKLVLGQTMTTDDGSSLGQAKVHAEVKRDIRDADAKQLAATINRDLFRPYVDLNFGPRKAIPQFAFLLDEPEDLVEFTKALVPLVKVGLQVEQSIVRDVFGFPEPAKGAAVLKAPEPITIAPASDEPPAPGAPVEPGEPATIDED